MRALHDSEGVIFNLSRASFSRQKPTRLPYSCQAQCGTSGRRVMPVGGGSAWRGIGRAMSHTSTLTMGHTTIRTPRGSLSGLRSTIAE